jgi:excisionase family DNA binding protein
MTSLHKGVRSEHDESASPVDKLVDCAAVAELLGVTIRHVRRLVGERRIPYVKIGSFVRFDPADVRSYVLSCRVAPATPPLHDLRRR